MAGEVIQQGRAAMGSAKRSPGNRLIEIIVVIVVVLVGAAWVMPNFMIPDNRARGAEAKQNLQSIQLAVERYAVDNLGYPVFLTGGNLAYAVTFDKLGRPKYDVDAKACIDVSQVADPLQREGYMPRYPRNPFVSHQPPRNQECVLYSAVHQAQINDPLWPAGGDPLRNGNDDASRLGTRFGADCFAMGQVLGDPRFKQAGGAPGSVGDITAETCAGVTYPYWDIWAGRKPKPFLPGEFFYRSSAPIPVAGNAEPALAAPAPGTRMETYIADSYVMGVYGGLRTKGKDAINSAGDPYRTQPEWPNNPSRGIQPSPVDNNVIFDAIVLVLESGYEVVEGRESWRR
jgi:type II secretory pathway pseudopilin PulG